MTLKDAKLGQTYTIKDVLVNDEALNDFLFTLGCYSGEEVTVISHLNKGYVISLKEARYNIDAALAQAITI